MSLYRLSEEHFIISRLSDFRMFYTYVPNHRRKVRSTEFVSYRHIVNAYQSVTESCPYHAGQRSEGSEMSEICQTL